MPRSIGPAQLPSPRVHNVAEASLLARRRPESHDEVIGLGGPQEIPARRAEYVDLGFGLGRLDLSAGHHVKDGQIRRLVLGDSEVVCAGEEVNLARVKWQLDRDPLAARTGVPDAQNAMQDHDEILAVRGKRDRPGDGPAGTVAGERDTDDRFASLNVPESDAG